MKIVFLQSVLGKYNKLLIKSFVNYSKEFSRAHSCSWSNNHIYIYFLRIGCYKHVTNSAYNTKLLCFRYLARCLHRLQRTINSRWRISRSSVALLFFQVHYCVIFFFTLIIAKKNIMNLPNRPLTLFCFEMRLKTLTPIYIFINKYD